MKVSLSWLNEYTTIDSHPQELASRLTMAGLEVESFTQIYDYLDGVVVGRVEKTASHPKADRLSCCRVNVGDRVVDIVCGAPNVEEGKTYPCALPGAVLPGDFKIKKSKLRGEVSEGMLCSGAELKLDSDSAGIMPLDPGLAPGTSLTEAMALSDYLFDIDLTPNRPDCLSVIGVAREAAVFQKNPAPPVLPEVVFPPGGAETGGVENRSIHDAVKVAILDPDLCPRYAAGLLVDVEVKPSPFWLQQRLESVGMTPVNNVVDVTNFVMLETGQPLHAFDYDLIAKKRIEVKRAGAFLEFTTLDGKEHRLDPDTLMICDGEKPVAIAGVMGGVNSEISSTTTRVLVESACFNAVSVRKAAKKSGIATDASHRFERGVDPLGTRDALVRAMALMVEISGASAVNDLIDNRPVAVESLVIDIDPDQVNRRLGTTLAPSEIQALLRSVAFQVNRGENNSLVVEVPSFRVDVTRPEDIFEEVARLFGYDNIKTTFPAIPAKREKLAPKIYFRDRVKEIMTGFGFTEAVNYSFTAADVCDQLALAPDDQRRSQEVILNPISEELSVLRSSLVPGLLMNMRQNCSKQVEDLRLFEIGKVFFARQKGEQPLERERMAGLWTGAASHASWYAKKRECDFFDLKGAVEGLFDALGIDDVTFSRATAADYPYFKKGHGAVVEKKGVPIGTLGQIDAPVLKQFSLRQEVFVFDMEMEALIELLPAEVTARSLPKYPSISRDITIIVDSMVEAGAVGAEIRKLMEREDLIEDFFFFDLYQGESLGKGKKSLSFRLVYRSSEKTLKEKKIKGLHAWVSKVLMERFDGDLPS
ncbi:MAG: phenylalanine--tRNA ligase subunit beta [Desulfobacteraceae bacterium]